MSAILRRLAGEDGAPRVLVVAAHPDDEVIGVGGRLGALADACILHLTDGAPRDPQFVARDFHGTREEYARVRRDEALAALRLVGVGPERAWTAGGVDQEATRELVRLARAVEEAARRARAEIVITHPYEGGHPDHDAAAFCVWAASEIARARGDAAWPIVEMTSYHAKGTALEHGCFLPRDTEEIRVDLTVAERRRKRAMLDCHRSQRDVLAPFGVDEERFRLAPIYDFERPPHDGALWYELMGWSLDGDAWRALAREARRALLA